MHYKEITYSNKMPSFLNIKQLRDYLRLNAGGTDFVFECYEPVLLPPFNGLADANPMCFNKYSPFPKMSKMICNMNNATLSCNFNNFSTMSLIH